MESHVNVAIPILYTFSFEAYILSILSFTKPFSLHTTRQKSLWPLFWFQWSFFGWFPNIMKSLQTAFRTHSKVSHTKGMCHSGNCQLRVVFFCCFVCSVCPNDNTQHMCLPKCIHHAESFFSFWHIALAKHPKGKTKTNCKDANWSPVGVWVRVWKWS